jgi:hypothetical protein
MLMVENLQFVRAEYFIYVSLFHCNAYSARHAPTSTFRVGNWAQGLQGKSLVKTKTYQSRNMLFHL